MEPGIPVLTSKGKEALRTSPPGLTSLCRNILVQVDGKKSIEDIRLMFRGLKGLEDGLQKLFAGNFIQISRECTDLVKAMVLQMLGTKAPSLIRKIDDLHAKHGDQCWDHIDELDRHARLFYGEVIADQLKLEISKILRSTKK